MFLYIWYHVYSNWDSSDFELSNSSLPFRFLSWCLLSQNPFLRIFSSKGLQCNDPQITHDYFPCDNWAAKLNAANLKFLCNLPVSLFSIPFNKLNFLFSSHWCYMLPCGHCSPITLFFGFFPRVQYLFHLLISILSSCFHQLHCFPPCLVTLWAPSMPEAQSSSWRFHSTALSSLIAFCLVIFHKLISTLAGISSLLIYALYNCFGGFSPVCFLQHNLPLQPKNALL